MMNERELLLQLRQLHQSVRDLGEFALWMTGLLMEKGIVTDEDMRNNESFERAKDRVLLDTTRLQMERERKHGGDNPSADA